MQYGMIIDLNRCVGCHACAIACKAEWDVPVEFGRNWVYHLGPALINKEMASTYYPGLCNHCTTPVCVPECPADPVDVTFVHPKTGEKKTVSVAATWKDPFDGTVQIDKSRCLGCGACVDACPYHARYINPNLKDSVGPDGKTDKCTYCKPRVEKGLEPACVQTCITGARIFGDLDDPESEVSKYVKKGAIGLDGSSKKLGPNSRYFGKNKDISLLQKTYTPTVAEIEQAGKRALFASLIKPARKSIENIGLLGVAGALVAESIIERKSE